MYDAFVQDGDIALFRVGCFLHSSPTLVPFVPAARALPSPFVRVQMFSREKPMTNDNRQRPAAKGARARAPRRLVGVSRPFFFRIQIYEAELFRTI